MQVACTALVHRIDRVWTIHSEVISHETLSRTYLLSHDMLNVRTVCGERALYMQAFEDVTFVTEEEPLTCLACIGSMR